MDPVRRIEQLNYQDWQREEAEAGRELSLPAALLIAIGLAAFIGLIAWLGGDAEEAYQHYLANGVGL